MRLSYFGELIAEPRRQDGGMRFCGSKALQIAPDKGNYYFYTAMLLLFLSLK